MSETFAGIRSNAILSTVLRSKNLRYALILCWGVGLIAVAGLSTAALWTIATLTAAHCRTLTESWLLARQRDRRIDTARDPRFLAVGFVTTCFWAAAPLIAWFSGHPGAQAVAVLYIAAGFALVAAQFRGAPAIMIAISAPYSLAALVCVADSFGRDSGVAVFMGLVVLAAAVATQIYFAAAVEKKVGAAHAENVALVEQLQLALDSMDAASWDLDFRTQTYRGSDAMADIYGRALTWADVSVPGSSFAYPDDVAVVAAAIDSMTAESPRASCDHRIVRVDGAMVWVRTTAIGSFTRNGVLKRLSGITHDVTDQKLLEMEIIDATRAAEKAMAEKRQVFNRLGHDLLGEPATPANDTKLSLGVSAARLRVVVEEIAARGVALTALVEDLDRARATAENANLAKSQFLANMSHELRTPLNAIIGYGEILQELAQARGDESDDKDLRRILTAANQLLHLINDVLDLSKIEAGRMDVAPAPFSVDLMLQDIAGTIEPMAAANRNIVHVDMDAGLGDAFTDRFKLSQCVLNLASNAVKFTKGGAVRLSALREYRDSADWIVIRVRDEGVGIAPDKLQKLFQPFVQADASVTRAYGGTGLGLAITRHLARLLGGDVTVESTPGRGSTFTLAVPATYRAPRFDTAA